VRVPTSGLIAASPAQPAFVVLAYALTETDANVPLAAIVIFHRP
jgi:hypothetical protein